MVQLFRRVQRMGENRLTVLEDHPVLLYTRTSQTGAHNVVVGCLIVSGRDPFHILKEAGRDRGQQVTEG